jgi:hypothetical protein
VLLHELDQQRQELRLHCLSVLRQEFTQLTFACDDFVLGPGSILQPNLPFRDSSAH